VNKKIENIRKVIIYFLKRAEEEHFPILLKNSARQAGKISIDYF